MEKKEEQTEAEQWKELFEMMLAERDYYQGLLMEIAIKSLEEAGK